MSACKPSASELPFGEVPRWLRVLLGTPLVLLGGFVTTCFGFGVCAYLVSRVSGGHPEPGVTHFLLLWAIFGAVPLVAGIRLLRKSQSRRRVWRRIILGACLVVVAVGVDGNFGPTNWHALFRDEVLPETDAALLGRTMVTPHWEASIGDGTNVLWCGTFQLAWNEACQLVGRDLQFEKDLPMISELNKHSFTTNSLDESSYVAMAGFVADDIHGRISNAVHKRFQGAFKPRFLPGKEWTPRPQDFVAYACLYKSLAFLTPFERLDETLNFRGVRVSAFGIGRYKASHAGMYPQVLILDYQSEDDFVIELKTTSTDNRLILAKVEPKPTLSGTIDWVTHRISQQQSEPATTNDLLVVPRMNIDVTRRYSEIEGLRLMPKGTNVAKDLRLLSAVQNTVFAMNEKGVELRSEVHMAFGGCARPEEPVPKHIMILDKPFLILMQRRAAEMPYFAFWVDNPEVLISWE